MSLRSLVRGVSAPLLRRERFYQQKRGNEENWVLIEGHLDARCRSLLDVGCDLGFYSVRAAKSGLFVLGVDSDEGAIARAQREARRLRCGNVAFASFTIDPGSVDRLPTVDVVLCLSVYHHFCRLFGEAGARGIMARLFERCRVSLFFQTPSKRGKYGPNFSVDFQHDEGRIRGYVEELFVPLGARSVRLVGRKIEKPPTEPYRYLFCIDRGQSVA